MENSRCTTLRALSDLYGLIAPFMVRTERDLARALGLGEVVADARAILGELGFAPNEIDGLVQGASRFAESPGGEEEAEELFHRVRRDYTHLFSNPSFSAVPVHESEFLGDGAEKATRNINLNHIARDVRDRYGRIDERVRPVFAEQPDHMGCELTFMGLLRGLEAAALEDGNTEAASLIAAEAASFFADHLGVWGGPFFAAVEREAREDAYRFVGRLGQALMARESAEMAARTTE